MTLWEAIWKSSLLGTVQGLTEFLPVSSSGHLSLLQRLLGFDLTGGSMTQAQFKPKMDEEKRQKRLGGWSRAVKTALSWESED